MYVLACAHANRANTRQTRARGDTRKRQINTAELTFLGPKRPVSRCPGCVEAAELPGLLRPCPHDLVAHTGGDCFPAPWMTFSTRDMGG